MMRDATVRAWVRRIDEARAACRGACMDDVLAVLSERHPVYSGLGANAAVRLRGYALASFERTGLPEVAIPYVVEVLETGQEPYLVAAAARALRGAPRPEPWMIPLLRRAAERIRFGDDTFSLDVFGAVWPVESPTTAMEELNRTLAWAGADNDQAPSGPTPRECCRVPADVVTQVHLTWTSAERRPFRVNGGLEDQDGEHVSANEILMGKPSIVGFFYTRCGNPMKCSRTVTALGDLQRRVGEAGLSGRVRILAITYDPDYDLPHRLRAYAEARGFAFDADNRALRARGDVTSLFSAFQLQVSFTGVTVSQHATELFVLDRQGRIAASFTRLRWEPENVMEQVALVLSAASPLA